MANTEHYSNEIRVRGVKGKLREELNNIADNLGVTVASIVKPKLQEIADSYAAHLKQPKKD